MFAIFQTESITEIAVKLAEERKENSQVNRTVVITRGDNSTILVEDGVLTEHEVTPIPDSEIVDTNGAGDAFVGGQYVFDLISSCICILHFEIAWYLYLMTLDARNLMFIYSLDTL